MSFRVQRLVNNFPYWSKMRRDPSSLGYRLFDVIAEYFDYQMAETRKLREAFSLYATGMGFPFVWSVQLDSTDYMTFALTVSGATTWTYPTTVVGNHATLGALPLTRTESLEDLLWGTPDRFTAGDRTNVANYLIWDSNAPTVFNTIPYAERLTVVISNSLEYRKRTGLTNPRASNTYLVCITGKDLNDIPIVENLRVSDDGVFFTQNIMGEVSDVALEGFDGRVEIYLATTTDYLLDPYRLGVTQEYEGPLKLALSTYNTGGMDYAALRYYTTRFQQGSSYRHGEGDLIGNEDDIWEQLLLDDAGNPYTPLDMTINANSTKLYVLDDGGFVHIYDHSPGGFVPPQDENVLTTDGYIEIQPIKPWALLDETMTLFTHFLRPKYQVIGVTIYLRKPDTTKLYLQSDLTWNAASYEFISLFEDLAKPEDTWQDIVFTRDLDSVGQWEFYATVRTVADTTTVYTGVLVDSLNAEISIDTGVASPAILYYSHTDELCVGEAGAVNRFVENKDVYYANPTQQQLIAREEYTTIEVTP